MPAIDDLAQTATAPATTTQPTAATEAPHQVLGRYRIERLIGAGGMGVVYAAFDPELERRVALKVLPDARRGQMARERLLREARAMARVTHPNVVRVYEVDSVDGHDFVAMELVDGCNLNEWCKTKRTPEQLIAAYVAAGRGLVAAHAAGIIHRDFKPHNVLCADDGRILVTDFGLARGIDDDTLSLPSPGVPPSRPSPLSGLTETGSVLGTPAYMAPEQRDGETVGPPADQFAFCVGLWEALAGKRPYPGKLEDMLAALEAGPSALDASKLPRRVRAPLLRGLEPDPDKRWPSMAALLGQISPRTYRWLIPALAAATVAIAIAIVIVGRSGGNPVCPVPSLDPAAVWPVGAREILMAKNQKPAAVLMQRDIEKWQELRDQACDAEPGVREAQLTCLDAVLTRFDAIAAGASATPTPLIDPADLIDPTVCLQSPPPRIVPASAEYRAAKAYAIHWAGTEELAGEAQLAQMYALAKTDPCAIALVDRFGTEIATSAKTTLERVDRWQTSADKCGDDHAIAGLALKAAQLELELHGRGDAAKSKLERAEIAVRRIPLASHRAQLEIIAATDLVSASKIPEAITRFAGAIDLLEQRGCYACLVEIRLYIASVRRNRMTGDDEIVIPQLFDQARALAVDKFGADDVYVKKVDAARASWENSLGHTEEAHRLLATTRYRRPNSKGKPIAGRVIDADGKPVAGATVTAASELAGDGLAAALTTSVDAYLRTATTDVKGEFAIPDAVEKGVMIAELGDRRSSPIAIAPTGELVLEPTSRIEGRVDLRGMHSTRVWIRVTDPEVAALPYGVWAPVQRDGRFSIAGVLRRELRVSPSVLDDRTSSGETTIVDAHSPVRDVSLAVTFARTIHVIVRSTVGSDVANAYVWIVKSRLATINMRDMEKRTDIASALPTQSRDADPPRELAERLGKGDRYATVSRAPVGEISACAVGYPRSEDYTEELAKKVEQHLERIEIRCVPVTASEIIVVEVPPFPRFD